MRRFTSICVYCGASPGVHPAHAVAARAFGRYLAENEMQLVFGGGHVGLMGQVADGALEAGGRVIGVIPTRLMALELAHHGCTELIVTDTMHARKMAMSERSDGFVALPGGYGTLDETFEALTWTQTNDHLKPVGLLQVNGYWDGLLTFLDHAADEGFVRGVHRRMLCADADPGRLLDAMAHAELPLIGDWLRS
jgi:uncharacterized protein (TIGR00730 family)